MTPKERAAWLAERRTGIGGSDAAAVCGVSRWATPLDVYLDKLGERDDNQTTEMRRGSLLEPVVRQMYADETGLQVRVPRGIRRSKKHAFMLANLDGEVVGPEERLVEIKTASSDAEWGDPGTDDIPVEYQFQVQHYLAVTGHHRADVAVLFGNRFTFAIYQVAADQELQQMIIEAEAELWDRVQRKDPPEPVTLEDCRRRFPRARKGEMIATADLSRACQELQEAKLQAEHWTEIADKAKALIQAGMGEYEILKAGDRVLATWKSAKDGVKFDEKAFAAEHPDLHKQFLKPKPGNRTFLLK